VVVYQWAWPGSSARHVVGACPEVPHSDLGIVARHLPGTSQAPKDYQPVYRTDFMHSSTSRGTRDIQDRWGERTKKKKRKKRKGAVFSVFSVFQVATRRAAERGAHDKTPQGCGMPPARTFSWQGGGQPSTVLMTGHHMAAVSLTRTFSWQGLKSRSLICMLWAASMLPVLLQRQVQQTYIV